MDNRGNTYIAEREGNRVRRVEDANGVMSTFAGTGERGYEGDGGLAINATWGAPKAIRCDSQDNIIVVDTENHAVRRIDPASGIVTTIAGGRLGGEGDGGPATEAGLDRPHGCDLDQDDNLYIADSKQPPRKGRRVVGCPVTALSQGPGQLKTEWPYSSCPCRAANMSRQCVSQLLVMGMFTSEL